MFKPFCSTDLRGVSLKDKRALLTELKASIKEDVLSNKSARILSKVTKENAKRDKVNAQILAAQEKLAKLQAKLKSA
jgi:uncharacterized membrane protein